MLETDLSKSFISCPSWPFKIVSRLWYEDAMENRNFIFVGDRYQQNCN